VTTTAVVRVHELDAGRQLAGYYRWMAGVRGVQLMRYHSFDCVRKVIEISYDAPEMERRFYE
jgi:hypothetical protein